MTIKEYQKQLYNTLTKVTELLYSTGYVNEGEAIELEIDTSDPSQVFDKEQANRLLGKLYECARKGMYLISPIQHEGKIKKTSWEQYELDGITLESGSILEVKLFDSQEERYHFLLSSIECDSQGYYLTCNGSHDLEGLEARLR